MQQAFASICNLLQNPSKVPVCGVFAPALLRSGKLWVMFNQHHHNRNQCQGQDQSDAASAAAKSESAATMERYLLADEHLTLMAVPMHASCSGRHAFPHIGISNELPGGAKRSLAGNAACLHVWLPNSVWH